jgi:hypothetical protein
VPEAEPAEETLSPSLRVASLGSLPAFEMKYLVSEALASQIERLARARLSLDPHGDPSRGNGYRTTTLYCDTAQLDVFYGQRPFRRRKHRLRRYGNEPWIFLERKYRRADRVKKRRSTIADTELSRLATADSNETWAGHWFHQQLVRRQLLPACRIAYHRVAYLGASGDGAMRLTIDREIRGYLTDEWRVDPFDDGLPILASEVICELKFSNTMPVLFKEIVETLHLTPTRVSKYRTFMRAVSSQLAKGSLHA